MGGVPGQGQGNTNAKTHGARALESLIQRGFDDPYHWGMPAIRAKLAAYLEAHGGPESINAMKMDILQDAAALGVLAAAQWTRMFNGQGRQRRMSAQRHRELAQAYSATVERRARLLSLVGLEGAEKNANPREVVITRYTETKPSGEGSGDGSTP